MTSMVGALWCSTQAKTFWFYILFLFHILSLVQRITKLDTYVFHIRGWIQLVLMLGPYKEYAPN